MSSAGLKITYVVGAAYDNEFQLDHKTGVTVDEVRRELSGLTQIPIHYIKIFPADPSRNGPTGPPGQLLPGTVLSEAHGRLFILDVRQSLSTHGAPATVSEYVTKAELEAVLSTKLPAQSTVLTSPSGFAAQYAAVAREGWGQLPRKRLPAAVRPEKPLAPGKSEAFVQDYLEMNIMRHLRRAGVQTYIVDHHESPSFGTRKPAFVGYIANEDGSGPLSLDAAHIVFIGEVKRRREGGRFTADEKGRVLSMCLDLAREQVFRASTVRRGSNESVFFLAFLTDGAFITFMQVWVRIRLPAAGNATGVEPVLLRESASLPLWSPGSKKSNGMVSVRTRKRRYDGLEVLNWAVRANPVLLGYVWATQVLADKRKFTLSRWRGCGATSVVYSATGAPKAAAAVGGAGSGELAATSAGSATRPAEFAVKLLFADRPHGPAAGSAEIQALRACAGARNIVQLEGHSEAETILVLTPLCSVGFSLSAPPHAPAFPDLAVWLSSNEPRPAISSATPAVGPLHLVRPRARDFCDMAMALQQLHEQGYVHRDVRLENWLRDPAGEIILSDLGAAAREGAVAEPDVPFGFCFGPIAALKALACDDALPPAQFSHDWEQLARVIIVAASDVKLTLDSVSPSQMLAAWKAADAGFAAQAETSPTSTAARFYHLLRLAVTDPFDSREFCDVIRSLMP